MPIHIAEVRERLLELHRVLAAFERVVVERDRGRLDGGQYLDVLINDPSLAWLLALSGLIVRIDELAEEPGADLTGLVPEIRQLLAPDAAGPAFQRRYAELLQDSPDAVLAHGA